MCVALSENSFSDSGSEAFGSSNAAVEFRNVEFRRRGRMILRDVNLKIDRGECAVLFGPNGIGKSTLISMMATRGFPTSGTVDILGNRLGKKNVFSYRHRIGLASAELSESIPPAEDPLDVVVTGTKAVTGKWKETYTDEEYDRAEDLMRRFGIGYLAGKQMYRLSSGERTRVLICRALMPEPDLLILDEPTTGLDLGGRELVTDMLGQIGANNDCQTVVLVTHRLEEIPSGFDRIAIMGREDASERNCENNAQNKTDVSSDPAAGTVIYSGNIENGLTDERLSSIFSLPLSVSRISGRWEAFAK